ncbi:MAG: hypothetical protein U9N42_05275 [Campylobacterota bacterium]|nr:hypothetical protein [Campylobacterota bacterium]
MIRETNIIIGSYYKSLIDGKVHEVTAIACDTNECTITYIYDGVTHMETETNFIKKFKMVEVHMSSFEMEA